MPGHTKYFLIFILTTIFLCSCAQKHQTITVESTPRPEIVASNGKPMRMSRKYILEKLYDLSPDIEEISINDKQYIYITEKWFFEMVDYTNQIIDQQIQGLAVPPTEIPGYSQVFAMFMNSLANIAVSRKFNTKGSVLIGLAVVKCENPWDNIPGDGKMRDYIIALTNNGGLIHDLQTGQTTKLKAFPNLKSIYGILF